MDWRPFKHSSRPGFFHLNSIIFLWDIPQRFGYHDAVFKGKIGNGDVRTGSINRLSSIEMGLTFLKGFFEGERGDRRSVGGIMKMPCRADGSGNTGS